ncbi:MAG: glycosyltransferase family 4 protein [Bacteroidetes bacterium]|nr:MAG: glycosyltransferase family 4 protein [Bacteroidota bacterium]
MPKICVISPSLKLGGIERALTVLAKEFVEKGFQVDFVCCLAGEHFYKLPKSVRIHEPDFFRTASILNKLFYYPRLLKYIRTKVKELNPDRVLVFGDWFSPVTLLALLGTKYPVYISDRTIPNYKFKFPIPLFKKWLYPKSAGFIAQTQRASNFKKQQFGEALNIKIIPNALPEMHFEALARENTILYAGRFAWEKDPEILIRSMPKVFEAHPEWKLVMAGTGPLLEPMKILVKNLGLQNQVIFLGKVDGLEHYYAQASILVLPSVIEGFPNTLIEGMAAGLPCICFSDIPYEDIIAPGLDGIVLTRREPNLLTEAMLTLINLPELRHTLGKEASQVKERFSASKITDEVVSFMQI